MRRATARVGPMSFTGRSRAAATVSAPLLLQSSKSSPTPLLAAPQQRGRSPGPTIDRNTGHEVQRFVVAPGPNALIEPMGGSTASFGKKGQDTHTLYPDGSNYQRYNPQGHGADKTPHGHGHAQGKGPGKEGQGPRSM
ncbi:hypothetical protein [Chitinimonas koreensis]|uniref:hypothetical protein n=1 Tax=Chitinimonas koreensis TaxID=356302 RepID=UPI001654BBB0|nr:hypothetical protein [Chitinimonas koreensis]QNM95335.1 hypothetical protein H9L41_15855 [Chitinimonas koreensis]